MANPEHVAMLLGSVEAWNAWRRENANVTVDLRQADLTGADLRGAMLHGATLDGVCADGARFDVAFLVQASAADADIVTRGSVFVASRNPSFRDASFRGAHLAFAKFSMADFSGAIFEDASFTGTHLDSCQFERATFTDAAFATTQFVDVDLSNAIGLGDTRHYTASAITTTTLRASRGRIPDAFLKGCGFSDVEILTSKLWDPDLNSDELTTLLYRIHDLKTTAPIQKRYVFISYAHQDAPFVEQLEQRFDALGIRFWRDKHDLKAGRIETQIDRAIGVHSIVLLVLSKHSVVSDWVEWEVSKARAVEKLHKRDVICPIALDDAWKTADWPGPLRRQIEDYHILDLSSPTEKDFAKLIDGLNLFY